MANPLAFACARASLADSRTVTARGNFLVPRAPHGATCSGALGMPHGGLAVGGAMRGSVDCSSAASHASLAQSSAAPGRAGTSQSTLGDPAMVRRVHRVVPKGVTAIATWISTVLGL